MEGGEVDDDDGDWPSDIQVLILIRGQSFSSGFKNSRFSRAADLRVDLRNEPRRNSDTESCLRKYSKGDCVCETV